jgi:Tfp pilus assembly protein PilF
MIAFRVLAVALCVAGVLAGLVAYRSERRVEEITDLALVVLGSERSGARDAGREEARSEALSLVFGARLLNPDTDIDVQVGLFLEPNRRRAEAILKQAVRREPENVFLWLALSKRQEREGRLTAAGRSYARARALDPLLPAPR